MRVKPMTYVLCVFMIVLIGRSTVFAQPPVSKSKKPVTIRLVCPAPEGDWPLNFKDQEFAKRFNERAKGEYVIQVISGGALVKLPEYVDAIRTGVVEMANAPVGMYSFLDQRLGLLELPFLFDSMFAAISAIPELEATYDRLYQQRFNARMMGLMYTGGLQLFSTKPVRKLEDWRGLMVGSFSPSVSALVKGLGGSPVSIMWVDMYEALQRKVIDAAGQGTHGGIVTGLHEICKHVTMFLGVAAWNAYLVNLDVWNRMPKHIQEIFEEEAHKAAVWMTDVTANQLFDMDMKALREKRVEVYFLPQMERERWKRALLSFVEQELQKAGETGQLVRKVADEHNRKHAYSEKGLY
ncbi:MAG: TRAP transporter substrate-binding protein DctP [Candidatus Bathyarchaeia archaeon]